MQPGPGSAAPDANGAEIARLRHRYIDLVERALTHLLYRPWDIRWDANPPADDYDGSDELREAAAEGILPPRLRLGRRTHRRPRLAAVRADDGRLKRLANVRACVERVIADGVPGDLIETGVWRGGVVIFMRASSTRTATRAIRLRRRLVPGRTAARPRRLPGRCRQRAAHAKALAIPRDDVERNFDLYGLLDERVRVPRRLVQGLAAARSATARGRSSGSTATCTSRRWTRSRTCIPGSRSAAS